MSDENDTPEPTQEELDARLDAGPSRMDSLKEKARALGITHSPNIGEETLAEKIRQYEADIEAKRQAAIAKPQATTPLTPPQARLADVSEATSFSEIVPASRASDLPPIEELLKLTTDEILAYPAHLQIRILRMRQRHEGNKLIRCQVHCNNPAKNDLHGEIFSVQNDIIGVVRKFIPFGEKTENGYHIPAILVEAIKRRKYQKVSSVKNPDGTERVVSGLVPEFNVIELPPLTHEELQRLAVTQAAAAGRAFTG